jgi:hypothetical protein
MSDFILLAHQRRRALVKRLALFDRGLRMVEIKDGQEADVTKREIADTEKWIEEIDRSIAEHKAAKKSEKGKMPFIGIFFRQLGLLEHLPPLPVGFPPAGGFRFDPAGIEPRLIGLVGFLAADALETR